MNTYESLVREALTRVAPDAELDALAPDADLRDTLELDSLDFLTFVETLSDLSGSVIDEDDYPKITTLTAASGFLANRM